MNVAYLKSILRYLCFCFSLEPFGQRITAECNFWHLFISLTQNSAPNMTFFKREKKNHSVFICFFQCFVFILPRLPTPHFSLPWHLCASSGSASLHTLVGSYTVILEALGSCWSLIHELNGLWLFLAWRPGRDVWVRAGTVSSRLPQRLEDNVQLRC